TYADIQVDAESRDEGVILRFITQNNWFIGKVTVEGPVKSATLRAQLVNSSQLELGELETDDKVRQGLDGIKQTLESNGFYRSRSQPKFTYDAHTNQVLVTYAVQPDGQAEYRGPEVLGNPIIPIDKLISAT